MSGNLKTTGLEELSSDSDQVPNNETTKTSGNLKTTGLDDMSSAEEEAKKTIGNLKTTGLDDDMSYDYEEREMSDSIELKFSLRTTGRYDMNSDDKKPTPSGSLKSAGLEEKIDLMNSVDEEPRMAGKLKSLKEIDPMSSDSEELDEAYHPADDDDTSNAPDESSISAEVACIPLEELALPGIEYKGERQRPQRQRKPVQKTMQTIEIYLSDDEELDMATEAPRNLTTEEMVETKQDGSMEIEQKEVGQQKDEVIQKEGGEQQKDEGGRSQRQRRPVVKAPPPTKPKKPKTKRKRSRLPFTGTTNDTGPFVPIRPYFHSASFLRIKDNEWEKEIDSDDENDQSWLTELENSGIHDFTDITMEEKKLIILWNAFMRSDVVIPAKKIPQMCLNFIEKHVFDIRDEGIDSQLPWHLVNLWDEGLISADHMSFCLEHYHNLAGSDPV